MFPVLVLKDKQGKLYHLRMDRPFESKLAKLITLLSEGTDSPRMMGSLWVEDMTEERYNQLDVITGINQLPTFINNPDVSL